MIRDLRFLFIETAIIALATLSAVCVFKVVQPQRPKIVAVNETFPAGLYISGPAQNPLRSLYALKTQLERNELVLFGSSELTLTGEAAIQNLYPAACGKRVLAIGAAGFQSLPILLMLARAKENLSSKSKIAVILSPVWFSERATPSDAFLRELEPHAVVTLNQKGLPSEAREAINRELRTRGDEFAGLYPDWLINRFPFLAGLSRPRAVTVQPVEIKVETPAAVKDFDWDAMEEKWKKVQQERAGGNPIGTNLEFYNRVKAKNPPYAFKPPNFRETEKHDLFALSKFLREHGVHAHFIMQPIHRRLYNQLEPYDRLFDQVAQRLKADGHTWQSYFTEPFDLNTLQDSAHFSEYTWVRMQRELCSYE